MLFGRRALALKLHRQLLSCYALRRMWPAVAKALVSRPELPLPDHTLFYTDSVLGYWLDAGSVTDNWLGRSAARAI